MAQALTSFEKSCTLATAETAKLSEGKRAELLEQVRQMGAEESWKKAVLESDAGTLNEKVWSAWGGRYRFSYSAVLTNSKNPLMRLLGWKLLKSSLAPKPTKWEVERGIKLPITEQSAEEFKRLIDDRIAHVWANIAKTRLREWIVDQITTINPRTNKTFGKKRFRHTNGAGDESRAEKQEFYSLAGKRGRGIAIDHSTPGYNTVKSRKLVDDLAKEAKDLIFKPLGEEGLRLGLWDKAGAKELASGNWLPRLWDTLAMGGKIRNFSTNIAEGEQAIINVIAGALKSTMKKSFYTKVKNPKTGKIEMVKKYGALDNAGRLVIARATYNVLMRSGALQHSLDYNKVLSSLAKKDQLANLLAEKTGMNPQEITSFVDSTFRDISKLDKSKHFRGRLAIDESYIDKTTGIGIQDLVVNDLEALVMQYTNAVSGEIGLAKIGIKRGQLEMMIQDIRKAYSKTDIHQTGWKGMKAKTDMNAELKALDLVVRHLRGQPLIDNADNVTNGIIRTLANINYSRVMNQVWMANLSELASVVSAFGWWHMATKMPSLIRLMKRDKFGRLNSTYMEELYGAFHLGNHKWTYNIRKNMWDEGYHTTQPVGGGSTKWVDNIEYISGVGKKIGHKVGGQWITTSPMQVFLLNEMLQKWARFSVGKGKHPFSKGFMTEQNMIDRLRTLDVDAQTFKLINSQFKKDGGIIWKKGEIGGEIAHLNFHNWDTTAWHAFQRAMRTFVRRGVQESWMGERAYFKWASTVGIHGDSQLGQLLFQFRQFMFTAWEKHFLFGVRQKDWMVWSAWMNSIFIGGLMHITRIHLVSLGMKDKEKNAFLDEKLTNKAIGMAAFQRSAWSSLIPSFWNMLVPLGTDDATWQFGGMARSGLDTNFLTGNPTFSFIYQKLLPTGYKASQAAFSDKVYFDNKDAFTAFQNLPLYNLIGFYNIGRHMAGKLPDPPDASSPSFFK
jgi:hypothetical protein